MTRIERKCRNCGQWNKGSDRCTNCDSPLAPEVIRQEEVAAFEEREAAKPPTQFDLLIERLQASRNPFVRVIYLVLYSVWLVYMAIVAFIVFLIAWTPG